MNRQLIIILLVALALILMTVQNPNPVSVRFLSWQAEGIPVIIVILISALMGVFISSFLGLKKLAKHKNKIRRLEEEIEDLKYPPVVAPDEKDEPEKK